MSYRTALNTYYGLIILYVVLLVGGIIGYISNIVKLVSTVGTQSDPIMLILRAGGIAFPPLGAILGFC